MYSAEPYGCNAWNSTMYLFIIWFSDKLAYLDMQTELQDCLYSRTNMVLKNNDESWNSWLV